MDADRPDLELAFIALEDDAVILVSLGWMTLRRYRSIPRVLRRNKRARLSAPAALPRINFFERRRKGSIFYADLKEEIKR